MSVIPTGGRGDRRWVRFRWVQRGGVDRRAVDCQLGGSAVRRELRQRRRHPYLLLDTNGSRTESTGRGVTYFGHVRRREHQHGDDHGEILEQVCNSNDHQVGKCDQEINPKEIEKGVDNFCNFCCKGL